MSLCPISGPVCSEEEFYFCLSDHANASPRRRKRDALQPARGMSFLSPLTRSIRSGSGRKAASPAARIQE